MYEVQMEKAVGQNNMCLSVADDLGLTTSAVSLAQFREMALNGLLKAVGGE